MAELDEIRQSLLLAKEALRTPAAARARLRTQLAATGAWPAATGALGNTGTSGNTASNVASTDGAALPLTAQPGARLPAPSAGLARGAARSAAHFSAWVQHPVAAWAAALLLGVGFGAGYWVGHNERTPAGTVSTTGAAALGTVPGTVARAASLSPAAHTSLPSNGASVARATLDDATHDDATHDDTTPDDTTPRNLAPQDTVHGDVTEGDTVLDRPSALDGAAAPRSATATAAPPTAAMTKPLPRSPHHAPRASGAPRFAAELALVQRAERAIRAHDPELALSLLADLDRAFPTPALREERRAARLLAECERTPANGTGLNTENEPRTRAEQFLAEQPGSVYSDRIRKLCALDANAALPKPSSEGSADLGH